MNNNSTRILVLALFAIVSVVFVPPCQAAFGGLTSKKTTTPPIQDDDCFVRLPPSEVEQTSIDDHPRRRMILSTFSMAMLLNSSPSQGATATATTTSDLDVAALLHEIPTFTIVDAKGVPFMVVGEDAKVTGYFFTTYVEADRILRLARNSADKAIREESKSGAKKNGRQIDDDMTNPWKNARISTVPLDSALTLVSKSTRQNYFRLAPAESDVKDALAVSGQEDLPEGKVPLFYYPDFQLDDGTIPLYFRKSELESAYRRQGQRPKSGEATVQVTELVSVLSAMVGSDDEELKSLRFIAPKESLRKKGECERAGGSEPPFFVGQRIIVL